MADKIHDLGNVAGPEELGEMISDLVSENVVLDVEDNRFGYEYGEQRGTGGACDLTVEGYGTLTVAFTSPEEFEEGHDLSHTYSESVGEAQGDVMISADAVKLAVEIDEDDEGFHPRYTVTYRWSASLEY